MVKKKLNALLDKIIPHRLWVQSAFLLLWLDPLSLRLHNICSPVFHCYACPLATFACPIGVIAQFGALQMFPFIAVGLLITIAAVFGSLICGWLCPFGWLQDLAAKVPTPRFKLPSWTGHFRYLILIATVLLIPYFFGESHPLFICRICPAGALEKALPDIITQAVAGETIVWPNAVKLTILTVFIVAIFITIRPWCRILCPIGAIFGLFNKFSIFAMRLDDEKCTDCGRCRTICSYGRQPDKDPNDSACIRCLECTKCAPKALTLSTIFEPTRTSRPETNSPPNS